MTALLTPLSPARPCGEDLSFSSEFDEIQELRRQDDPTLEQGEWITALKSADWHGVAARCDQLLSQRSKDLRLLVWRIEALAQVRGFSGLAEGLKDCVQVCEAFWDGLHPLPEEGDLEPRAGPVRWLLQQLRPMLRLLPVASGTSGRCTLGELEDARQLQLAMDRDPDHASEMAQGKMTLVQVQRACKDSPPTFLRDNLAAADEARMQLQALQRWLDPRLGDEAPSFVHARQALDDAWHAIDRVARDAGALPKASALAAMPETLTASPGLATAAPATASQGLVPGEPATRAQALQQLRAVADFFRRTEPHSPVAMLADKAARWGDMPLHAWLREVVKDSSSLSHLEEMLDFKPATGES